LLRWRLISAAAILSVVFALLWIDYQQLVFRVPGAWLLPLAVAVSALATEEVLNLLAAKKHRPMAWVVYLGNVLLPIAAALPILARSLDATDRLLMILAGATALALLGAMSRYQRPGRAMVEVAFSVFATVYIGLLISFWLLLRLHGGNNWGMAALFSMLLVTKMADVGAYTFGKNFGRTKLTPILSPGKTWEGALGGIVTACLTSWAFFEYAASAIVGCGYVKPAIVASLVYGLLLALAGIVGDLAESLLKRDMERKDSSTWLPGLGGVLDIIDAPLMAGPVAWVCWQVGLLGP
jgi:phosphatidate cytidylyltransferase